MTNANDAAQKLLDPVLQVFGGNDGGAAFSRLRHVFTPQLLAKPNKTELEESVVVMMTQYAKLCQLALDGKL